MLVYVVGVATDNHLLEEVCTLHFRYFSRVNSCKIISKDNTNQGGLF